jgi:DNA-directed RNA polymerase specialized sigma24 family protein
LPDDNRELLLTYYAGNQPAHLELRQAVAQRLGIPSNQLRLRATRTRKQLEESVMADSTSGGTR